MTGSRYDHQKGWIKDLIQWCDVQDVLHIRFTVKRYQGADLQLIICKRNCQSHGVQRFPSGVDSEGFFPAMPTQPLAHSSDVTRLPLFYHGRASSAAV